MEPEHIALYLLTAFVCPLSMCTGVALFGSQITIVPSRAPLAMQPLGRAINTFILPVDLIVVKTLKTKEKIFYQQLILISKPKNMSTFQNRSFGLDLSQYGEANPIINKIKLKCMHRLPQRYKIEYLGSII